MASLFTCISPYLQLMRWYQPVGYWLLLWPCWWSVALASYATGQELPDARLMALFLIGAVAMRSAGCVVNDLWDRKYDAMVERTKSRPLASGALKPIHAIGLLAGLLLVALLVVLQLRIEVLWLAIASLPLVVLYPLMKRITWWPQAFLGLTFNFGALMGWAAVTGEVGLPAMTLYIAGIFWTLGYDTIYAHQDREDDEQAGVKSTARLFADKSKRWVGLFYVLVMVFFVVTGMLVNAGLLYYLALLAPALHLLWQLYRFNMHDRAECLRLFRSNQFTGFYAFLAIVALYLQ